MSDDSSRGADDASGDIGLDLNRAIAESLSTLSEGYDGTNDNNDHNNTNEAAVKEEDDDLALENAIGDVFGLLVFPGLKQDQNGGSAQALQLALGETQDGPHTQTGDSQEPHSEAYDNEVDLEAAIGAAFEATHEKEHPNDAHSDENDGGSFEAHLAELLDSNQPTETHSDVNDEEDLGIDLDAAIGDAFKSIAGAQEATEEPQTELLASQEPSREETDDINLEEAIGDAFKSIAGHNHHEETERQHSAAPESDHTEAPNDDDLNAMISASFKLLMEKEPNDSAEGPRETNSFAENTIDPQLHPKRSDEGVDLSSIVHNIVSQMATSDADKPLGSRALPISDDILQELALEITNQVQDHIVEETSLKTNSIRNLPQIDDNVLEHFQNEAHKDDADSRNLLDESSLKAALATVVRNAIENNATTLNDSMKYPSTRRADEPQEADLEKLHMNEILQNAFTMAMENPQDLLSNMEVGEEDAAARARSIADTASALYKIQSALPSSTSRFLESLNRSDDIRLAGPGNKQKLEGPEDRLAAVTKDIVGSIASSKDETRKLSIAETLALHRSSMAAGRRDYSAMESLKNDPRGPMANPQLLSVLSSLSSHINSTGGSDNNLLQVIRQMTNALTSGGPEKSLPPSLGDIVASYKDKPEEASMVNSLTLARKVLLEKPEPVEKAVSMVEKVLGLFGKSVDVEVGFGAIKPEFISSLQDLVENALANFGSRGGRFFGERPRIDTPEYKERIRVENRERKKKWREDNAERNKDNDLRSRVLKRATLMFGEIDTPQKKAWADDEFNKRRNKRIAKIKKDDNERSKGFLDDTLGDRRFFRDKENNALAEDPGLSRPIRDIFHMLSDSIKDDKQAAWAATSAVTATAAAIYASNNTQHDPKTIDDAVSSILASILDGLGDQLRISSQSRESYGNSNIFSRLSATIRDFQPETAAGSSIMDMSGLNIDPKKRKTVISDSHDPKRQRSTSPLGRLPYMENDKTSISKIASELDQIRNSIASSSSSPLWGSASALKMPQYKKPEAPKLVKEETVSAQTVPKVILPVGSPFISNKASFGDNKAESPLPSAAPAGLRKPGSFQRPAFSKPKGRNMAFPPLYSASFRQS